ncbi:MULTISPECIES: HNH endonuclease family protein [unclassified Microcoleus]|uniref:HNH endonuclease family protein n=1 Tax=unclassified Microcoleus TaxID=2642155 RepID=UPI002FD5A0AC
MINIIHDCKEDPMRFLRYYIMSHYQVNLQNNFPEEAIYDWFTNEGSRYKIDKYPLKFVDTLIKASEDFSNFTRCKNVDGSDNQSLKNIKKLQGRYSQHFILLLAAREMPKDLFIELCCQIENLLFTYTITRSTRKDINMIRDFSQWSQNLLEVRKREDFEAFIELYFTEKLASLSNEFNSAFRELTESKIATYRIRYVLAKITQFVDNQAYSNTSQLDRYLDKSITIEHILPKSVKPESRSKFDKPNEYGSYVEKLGNLVLLEKTINSSLSDSMYDAKKSGYKQSQLLLTRSLVEKPAVGNNTQLNRTVNHLNLDQFDVWDSKAIDKRQEMLINLARRVWGFEK